MPISLDPGIYTQIQSGVIGSFNTVIASVTAYSRDLLYLCASLDIVLFALLWIVQGNNAFARLIFTVLKIGFLLMVINEFDTWLNILLSSFSQIAATSGSNASLGINLIEAPGAIWQLGYDNAILLLKAAANDGISMGLSLLLTSLGLGLLLIFGLLGARLIVGVAAFYLSALIALIFLPLGVLKPTADFAYRGLQSVLKNGVALLTLLLILTAASQVWQGSTLYLPEKFNLNQVFGLFFASLVFLLMSQQLPKIAAAAIGQIKPLLPDNVEQASVNPASLNSAPSISPHSDLRAAATLDSGFSAPGASSHFSAAVQISPSAASSSGSLAPDMAKRQAKSDRNSFDSATTVAPSISGATLQKLKATERASDY